MNTADIDTARRLIAQFEGNALRRHNSGQFRENPVADKPAPIPEQRYPTEVRGRWIPEQRRQIVFRDGPQDCRVGEYCFMVGRRIPDDLPIFRFIPLTDPRKIAVFDFTPSVDLEYWEFERVRLVDPRWPDRPREAWHRIA